MPVVIKTRDVGLDGPAESFAVLTIVLTIMAAVFVLLRTMTRKSQTGSLGKDDVALWTAMVFDFGMGIMNLVAANYGFGRRQSDLSSSDSKNALMMFWLTQIAYKLVMLCTKWSVLLLYLRLFPNRTFRVVVFCLMGVVAIYMLILIGFTIGQCQPISRAWDTNADGWCINIKAFWLANASLNISSDFGILALPMPFVFRLVLPWRKKLSLSLVIALGGFVCVTSILRMTTLDFASMSIDRTSGTLDSTIWTTVEANTAIICACLPVLRSAFTRLKDHILAIKYGQPSVGRHQISGSVEHTSGHAARSSNSRGSRLAGTQRRASRVESDSAQHIVHYDDLDMVPMGVIAKRTEIDVRYEEDCSSSSNT